jgi:DNA-binding transcriptional LysR family regulator
MTSQIEGVKGLHTGKVVVGIGEDISADFLSPLITEFKQEFEQIELSIQNVRQNQLEEQLVSGEIDFALFYQPQLSRHIKINYSKQVNVSIVAPNGVPLSRDKTVRLHELEGLNLVTPPHHTELMVKMEGAYERQNMVLKPYLACTNQNPILIHANKALIGIVILPIPHKNHLPLGYKALPLNNNDVGTGYLNIVVEKKRHMTFAASKLHERLTALLDG